MCESILKLGKDVEAKFARLCSMYDQPALHVADLFFELRTRVDIEAEEILEGLSTSELDEEKVNKTRTDLIRILKGLEEKTLRHLPPNTSNSTHVFASLKQRTDEFCLKETKEADIDELEDAYLQLVLEIVDETNRLEKLLLGNQAFIYVSSGNKSRLGPLVYLSEEYLSREEAESLCSMPPSIKDVHAAFVKSLNDSLAVPTSKPFILTKRHLLIYRIAYFLSANADTDTNFFHFGKLYQLSDETAAVVNESSGLEFSMPVLNFLEEDIEGFDTSENIFEYLVPVEIKLRIGDMKLNSLDSRIFPFFESIVDFYLSDVQLDSFDGDLLAKCVNLTILHMQNVSSDDGEFNLEFLNSLRMLESLFLTLPSSSTVDFAVFERLEKLTGLELESASIVDSDNEYFKLDENAWKLLFAVAHLSTLSLSGFEIEIVDENAFHGFKELKTLFLTRNRIENLDESVFKCGRLSRVKLENNIISSLNTVMIESEQSKLNTYIKRLTLRSAGFQCLSVDTFSGLSSLIKLTLDSNKIRDLPPGVFDSLVNIETISLRQNCIQAIKRGVFDKLTKLMYLDFTWNSIDEIEADSFLECRQLLQLYLIECRLKSINNRMFTGLSNIRTLDLSCNRIESIELVTEDSTLQLSRANLAHGDLYAIKKHMFNDLKKLEKLHMNQNKLEQLDLNIFFNMVSLETLDLESNMISEINQHAEFGLLSKLSKLCLARNQLTSIEKHAFCDSTKLKYLDLGKNKIRRLEEHFLDSFPVLRSVDLSENHLEMTITDATFANCRNSLVDLYLFGNESLQAEDDAFDNMPLLRNLDCGFSLKQLPKVETFSLRECHSSIFKETFKDKKNLKNLTELQGLTIIIKNNGDLPIFNLSMLDKMASLSSLNLSGVLIKSLDSPGVFAGLPNLSTLRLRNNRLEHINRKAFDGLSKLRNLEISNNHLSNMYVGLFRSLLNLVEINLSGNKMETFNLKMLLQACKSLRVLNFSNNQLDNRSINRDAMSHNVYITDLILGNNRLENMEFVRELCRLQKLDLSNNRIEGVEKDGCNLLGRRLWLYNLNLSGNRIKHIREETFAHLIHDLLVLDISKNPVELRLDSVLSEFLF